MNDFIDNLKRQAEENPILALGVAAGLMTAASKLIGTLSDAKIEKQNARNWAREVARREMKDRKKS